MKPLLALFDAGLLSMSGHHFNIDRGIINHASARGVQTIVFGNRNCRDREIQERIQPKPLFSRSVYGGVPNGADRRPAFLAANEAFYAALRNVPLELLRPENIFFFHTVHSPNLLGLARWLLEIAPDARPHIVMYLMINDYVDEKTGRNAEVVNVYKEFFRIVNDSPSLRIRVLAESRAMQTDLQEFSGRPDIALAPVMYDYKLMMEQASNQPSHQRNQCYITYLGHSRLQKGVMLIPEVAQRVCSERPIARFVVQGNFTGAPTQYIDLLNMMFRRNDLIEYLEGPLTEQAYYRLLGGTDIVMLPYTIGYSRAGSGILREALMLGKVLVVPEYCDFQEELNPYGAGCVYFKEWTARSIADAVIHAMDNLTNLSNQAKLAVPRFLEERGALGLFDELFGVDCL